MSLSHDIVLDDMAFMNASSDMKDLKLQTENLKTRLKHMYKDLTTAMDTPAGKAIEAMAESVLIKPIDDMLLIIEHISLTLTEIIDTSYYKNVFIKFDELNTNVKF